jgi:2-alkenal reductase
MTRWFPILTLLVGVGLGAIFFPATNTSANNPLQTSDFIGNEQLTDLEQSYANVYNNLAPSVVSITVAERASESSRLTNVATGSGFVIDFDGHIVTNFHVVQDADRIEIQMYDGTIAAAEVIGLDPDSDIAVIKLDVPTERLRPVVFANSDNLQIGQTVLALGNPFENNWTLTTGIVSATNRRIFGLNSYSVGGVIQTDAAINPGNSGGPLLNLRGEVVGMNSQISTETGTNTGIGYAVPSNLITKVATSLMQSGEMRYPFIGITQRTIDLDLIEAFALPNNIRGVAILEAVDGLPAELAGFQSISATGVDIITAIEGVPMNNFDELVGWLAINTVPGQTVNFTVYRNGQTFTVPVTLAERPTR